MRKQYSTKYKNKNIISLTYKYIYDTGVYSVINHLTSLRSRAQHSGIPGKVSDWHS